MPYYLQGTVLENGAPVERTVRLYLRSTGELLDEDVSSSTGEFIFIGLSEFFNPANEFYVIALDDDPGDDFNALIFDRVEPLYIEGWATWDPFDKTTNMTLSNNDLTGSADTDTYETVRANRKDFGSDNGGKFFWKIFVNTLGNDSDMYVGLKGAADTIASGTPYNSVGAKYAVWRGSGGAFAGGGWSAVGSAPSYAAGDELMFAVDLAAGKFWIGKNSTWSDSGDPENGTNPMWQSMPSGVDHAVVLTTDNTGGSAVSASLITDEASLTADCPAGFTAGIPA